MSTLYAYGSAIGIQAIRRVWAAVTHNPCASLRELEQSLPLSHSQIVNALDILYRSGYIEQSSPRAARARRVIVPFVEVTK